MKIQNVIKLLRSNLRRLFHYTGKYSFLCNEKALLSMRGLTVRKILLRKLRPHGKEVHAKHTASALRVERTLYKKVIFIPIRVRINNDSK